MGTLFEFVKMGLELRGYEERRDYSFTYASGGAREGGGVVTGVDVFKSGGVRRSVTYGAPHSDLAAFSAADVVCIDEAAAIPLTFVRSVVHASKGIVVMSSTVKGYEGTGRGLSLKLFKELREGDSEALASDGGDEAEGKGSKKDKKVHEDRWKLEAAAAKRGKGRAGNFVEVCMEQSIRYSPGDPVEAWLDDLLCFDERAARVKTMTRPSECEAYMVDRDALFSYHSLSEKFLKKIWGVVTEAHYKNSPDDLMLLSDSPGQRMFVLLGEPREGHIPDVMAVCQVALEGGINKKQVAAQLGRGKRESGDLIPWTVSQQFGDAEVSQDKGKERNMGEARGAKRQSAENIPGFNDVTDISLFATSLRSSPVAFSSLTPF